MWPPSTYSILFWRTMKVTASYFQAAVVFHYNMKACKHYNSSFCTVSKSSSSASPLKYLTAFHLLIRPYLPVTNDKPFQRPSSYRTIATPKGLY